MNRKRPARLELLHLSNDVGRGSGAGVLEVASVDDVLDQLSVFRVHRAGRRHICKACTIVRGRAETEVLSDNIKKVYRIGNLAISQITVAGDETVSDLHRGTV